MDATSGTTGAESVSGMARELLGRFPHLVTAFALPVALELKLVPTCGEPLSYSRTRVAFDALRPIPDQCRDIVRGCAGAMLLRHGIDNDNAVNELAGHLSCGIVAVG